MALLLKVWSMDHQQHHVGACQKFRISGSSLDPLNLHFAQFIGGSSLRSADLFILRPGPLLWFCWPGVFFAGWKRGNRVSRRRHFRRPLLGDSLGSEGLMIQQVNLCDSTTFSSFRLVDEAFFTAGPQLPALCNCVLRGGHCGGGEGPNHFWFFLLGQEFRAIFSAASSGNFPFPSSTLSWVSEGEGDYALLRSNLETPFYFS